MKITRVSVGSVSLHTSKSSKILIRPYKELFTLHVIGPTCHYDVIDIVFVAKGATAPLGNKHNISDVIMTRRRTTAY